MPRMNFSRRRFLTHSSLGLLAFSGMPGFLRAMEGMQAMPALSPNKASPNFKPDVEMELFCKSNSISILSGKQTLVQQYTARLLRGPEGTLANIPGSYLGPILRFQKGQKVRIHLINKLPEATITHWHGLHVPAVMDGHPQNAIASGQTYVYEFEVLNGAGMNIYHPHPHEATARQVYHGLAGALFINDAKESALELPSGEYEIPIVIQDRTFDEDNQLIYVRSMHDRMTGFHGDRILVNGFPNFKIDVATRAYRLRIINGSNARIYKLAWDDGMPLTVIGVEGGLLEMPENKPYAMLGPGEGIDVWADFSGRNVGSQLVMRSQPFSGALPQMAERMMGGGMGMHGGMMGGTRLPVGSDYPIFTVNVTRKVSDSPKLPTHLSTIERYKISDTANPSKPVPIGISEGPMSMILNGRPYAYNDVQDIERIPVNTIQLMEIFHAHGSGGHGMQSSESGNEHVTDDQKSSAEHQGGGMGMMGGMGMHGGKGGQGGMMGMGMHGDKGGQGDMMGMMSMAHPIHLHGQSFQIVSRTIDSDDTADYDTVRDGFIDSGLKNTVLVMPGEMVRIIKPFQDFKGSFMFHCHNLEHEDMGMMREFSVE